MSTLTEIQAAVAQLRADEKKALSVWLASQTVVDLGPAERERLFQSLDDAVREIDSGRGVPASDVRQLVRTWAAK